LLVYSRDEFLGKEIWEIGLLNDEKDGSVAVRELQKTGFIYYEDLPIRAKQGSLSFSRQQVLKPEVIDLNKVIGEISNMLQRLISKDIRLFARLASKLNHIKADSGHLSHLIMNLVAKARDAMPYGGNLTIETQNFTVDKKLKKFNKRHIVKSAKAQPSRFACRKLKKLESFKEDNVFRQSQKKNDNVYSS
jgi:hypothetical protein